MENQNNPELFPKNEESPENKNEERKRQEQSSQKQKETKPLTLEEIQRRRKMLVYPLFFLLFLGVMWLIFAPSGSDGKLQEGFNIDVPMPEEKGLLSDKKTAYEQNAFERKQKEKMNTLQDLAISLDEKRPLSGQEVFQTEEVPQEQPSPIRSSANAYQNINRQLGNFYESPTLEDDQKTLELEWRIQELERKAEEERKARETGEEQLRLMEKSYEMAARYMPRNDPKTVAVTAPANDKTPVAPVKQMTEQVVSLLTAPMTNEEFVQVYSQPRNLGFHTVGNESSFVSKNSIRVCVYKTVTVTGSDGKEVELRLLEPIQAGELHIPAGTILTGLAKINGERMDIAVTSIAYRGNILPVDLDVYDTNGIKGVAVPGSQELTALKEMAANMGATMGSSINISTNAGAQLASDLGRGVIQGASQYLSTKFRTAKATLKANYELLLVTKK